MNGYFDIFAAVLRVVTFQAPRTRRDIGFPGSAYPRRAHRSLPDRAGGHDPYA